MIDIQLDVLDVQVRDSKTDAAKCAERGLNTTLNLYYGSNQGEKVKMKKQILESIKILKNWDAQYALEEVGASIYLAWES